MDSSVLMEEMGSLLTTIRYIPADRYYTVLIARYYCSYCLTAVAAGCLLLLPLLPVLLLLPAEVTLQLQYSTV